jgi:hypothetical protein
MSWPTPPVIRSVCSSSRHVESRSPHPFWPPTGIALTAPLLIGLRTLPGVLAGVVMINLITAPPAAMIPTATGPTLACRCAYCDAMGARRSRCQAGPLPKPISLPSGSWNVTLPTPLS